MYEIPLIRKETGNERYIPESIFEFYKSEPAFRDGLRKYYLHKFNIDVLNVDLNNRKQVNDILDNVIKYRYQKIKTVFLEYERDLCVDYIKNIVDKMQAIKRDSMTQQSEELKRSGNVNPLDS